MSKEIQSAEQRVVRVGEGRAKTIGRVEQGFVDKTGSNPKADTLFQSGVAQEALTNSKSINTHGARLPVDIDMGGESKPSYTRNIVTRGGHIIEMNDTPLAERISIRHKDGSGVNIGPDGSIVVSSTNKVEVVSGDNFVTVTGDGNIHYSGNLKLTVDGDFEVNCDKYIVNAEEKVENIGGNSTSTVTGDMTSKVIGNQSTTVVGVGTQTYLNDLNIFSKGEGRIAFQEGVVFASGGILQMTGETRVDVSSPDMNLAATSMSVFGTTGTIGGDNIVHYGKNYYGTSATLTAGVTAPTFHGDLDGTATTATVAQSQNYADPNGGGGTGSAGSITNTATDNTATVQPTAALLTDYLKSDRGVKEVLIDPDDRLKQNIDLTEKNGKVSKRQLDTANVRRSMREQSTRENSKFIANAIANGHLSPEHTKTTPPNTSNIVNPRTATIRGQTPIGNLSSSEVVKKIKAI